MPGVTSDARLILKAGSPAPSWNRYSDIGDDLCGKVNLCQSSQLGLICRRGQRRIGVMWLSFGRRAEI